MKELTEIVRAWESICASGREALLATVVSVSGSTYRRPGARMLMTPEGRLAGSVSGGCLEGDILKKAWWRTQNGPVVVTYDSTDEEDIVWGFGLGCNGVVKVLLERVSADMSGPLNLLRDVLLQRQPGVIATVIGSEGAAQIGQRLLLTSSGTMSNAISDKVLGARVQADAWAVLEARQSRTATYLLLNGSTADVFLEAVLPPAPLVIFGANHDAVPLVRLAKEMGWHVTVVDTRATHAKPDRFPSADLVLADSSEAMILDARTAAVVMTHNYPDDRRVLRLLLESPAGYIGQLGPRARTERLLAEISDDGFVLTEDHRRRLHAPVGLDLGADTPEEIALSIVAEIQAARTGRAGGLLRDRRAPLHPHLAPAVPMSTQPSERPACQIPA